MKLPVIVLLASLAANAALTVVFVTRPSVAPPILRDYLTGRPAEVEAATAANERQAARADQNARVAASRTEAARRQLWASLDTNDLPQLVERLRAAGFSRVVIRSIINAKLEERFEAKMRDLTAPLEALPYWKPDPTSGMGMMSFYEQYNQIYRERSRALRELLGSEFFTAYSADPSAALRRQYGNLPQAKIDLVQRIVDDYAEMTSQVRAAMQNVTLPEDREKLALLEREKKADLASLLSPQELEDYEMRSSPVTTRLRQAFTIMDASEGEFRSIYKIQQAYYDSINPPTGMMTSDMMTARTDAQKKQADQLRAALGDARYREFARASNSDYQQLYRMAQRDNVPIEAANRAFDLRDTLAQESSRIINDRVLDTEAKRTALKTLGQNARIQIVGTLGPNLGTSYSQTARWLTHVENGGALTPTPDGNVSYRSLPPPRP
jgi:hypothetical protein